MRTYACLGLYAVVLAMSGGCTTTAPPRQAQADARVQRAATEPLRDISLLREDPPDILKRAADRPYALADAAACSDILAEIVSLDLALGPDVDADVADPNSAADVGGLAAGAVQGVVGLPFRGVIRRLSGAEERDKVIANAILSGVARRGFLKGVARAVGCSEAAPAG